MARKFRDAAAALDDLLDAAEREPGRTRNLVYPDYQAMTKDAERQAFHRGESSRELLARNWLRSIHSERDLVGKEVRDEVHQDGDRQRNEHSIVTAKYASDGHQKQRQSGQKERGLKSVSHSFRKSTSLDDAG